MPQNYDTKKIKSQEYSFNPKQFDILKNKLKLDRYIIERLVNSKGSIKSSVFFNTVSKTIRYNEK